MSIFGANTSISTYRLVDDDKVTNRQPESTIAQADAYLESPSPEMVAVLGDQAGMEIFDCYVEPGDYRTNDLVIDDKGNQYFIIGIAKHLNNDDTDDLMVLKLHKKTDQYNTANSVLFAGTSGQHIAIPWGTNLAATDWSVTMIVNPTELIFRVLSGGQMVYTDSAFLAQLNGTGLGRTIVDARSQMGGILLYQGKARFGSFLQGLARDSSFNVEIGEWSYLGMTYSVARQELLLYANGELVGSFLAVVPEVADGNFLLGAHKSTTTNMIRSYMSQFRFFTEVVTEQEMRNWYRRNVKPNKQTEVEYLFKAGSGTYVEDTSGNGRHGTMVGSVTYSPESPFDNQ